VCHPAKRFVYIIRSVNHPERQYVGVTAELSSRLEAHNAGHNRSTFADAKTAFLYGYRDRSIRRQGVRPALLEAPFVPMGHRALTCAASRRYDPVLFRLEVHARSRRLACADIPKGIDDDAHSTRVRSIGRSDRGLAGVGRLGSRVNHRLA
jgi:hypothetical protein